MKRSTISKFKKKVWTEFSKYIRNKYAVNGRVMCVTCGDWKDIKEMQAGHFIPGRRNCIIFDERNVHPQCYACNICKNGNTVEYFRFMQHKYGDEVIEELRNRNNQESKQFTMEELETLYNKFKEIL